MTYKSEMLVNGVREKQRSREVDLARLRSGQVNAQHLRRENGFASALPIHLFRIARIGDKPFRREEPVR